MPDPKIRTWAEVSLANLEHNYLALRKKAGENVRFLAPVKADAYGHGAVAVSKKLAGLGASYLAVACFSEAAELREAGVNIPILILGYTPPELAPELLELNITQTVSDLKTAREMSKRITSGDRKLKIHIKLDTGMARLGFPSDGDSVPEGVVELLSLPGLFAEGVFTHFAVSDVPGDPFTAQQYRRFKGTADKLEAISGKEFQIRHCANSGAVVNYEWSPLDMIRPGIALYGLYEDDTPGMELRQVMSLKTRIAYIQDRAGGTSVSYGRTYFTKGDRRIAALPIGYADGLTRILSNNMDVLIHGVRCPQVGRICMDMCMVDITSVPSCAVGDTVTVFGQDGDDFIKVEELSKKAQTITYEIVCGVSRRVPRIYLN